MVKKIITRIKNRKVIKIAKLYAEELSKNYDIEAVILFGSYAKGTNHEDSDIDIVVVTDDFDNSIFEEELNLVKLRRNIDLRIEPHLVEVDDYKSANNPFIKEVIETGIRVL